MLKRMDTTELQGAVMDSAMNSVHSTPQSEAVTVSSLVRLHRVGQSASAMLQLQLRL